MLHHHRGCSRASCLLLFGCAPNGTTRRRVRNLQLTLVPNFEGATCTVFSKYPRKVALRVECASYVRRPTCGSSHSCDLSEQDSREPLSQAWGTCTTGVRRNVAKQRQLSLRASKNPKSAAKQEFGLPITSGRDVEASFSGRDDNQGLEAGVIPESRLYAVDPSSTTAQASTSGRSPARSVVTALYPPAQRSQISDSWRHLMRWSKVFKRNGEKGSTALDRAEKVVVFGGGSFGTAMGAVLARQKADLQVILLLRDPYVCCDINQQHVNTRYLKDNVLPHNVTATTSMAEAIEGAQYAIHAVPVQHSRAFLCSTKELLPPNVPIISVSKGLELGTGKMMSELIPQALGRRQPAAFLSGPSFAKEVMDLQPTGIVAASKDAGLAKEMQELFASPYMRVNNTSDVIGVEICGALKNVLAIAAGIVEGLALGNNAMAALITQGCAEIRWLAEKMGARPATVAGLSGLGDIMLTCYGSLSRNRSVGVRLGRGEELADILASSKQVAEGVSTAGVVVSLARKYRVKLPVLTAVAHILNSDLTPKHAVAEIMNLPQIEER